MGLACDPELDALGSLRASIGSIVVCESQGSLAHSRAATILCLSVREDVAVNSHSVHAYVQEQTSDNSLVVNRRRRGSQFAACPRICTGPGQGFLHEASKAVATTPHPCVYRRQMLAVAEFPDCLQGWSMLFIALMQQCCNFDMPGFA